MASVYSGAGDGRYGTVTVKGQVEFGMQYNYKQSALEIYVAQCKDLAAVDTKRNRSDPYVKVSTIQRMQHFNMYIHMISAECFNIISPVTILTSIITLLKKSIGAMERKIANQFHSFP